MNSGDKAGREGAGRGGRRRNASRGQIVGRVGELKRNSRRGRRGKKKKGVGVSLAQHPPKMYLPQIKKQIGNMISIQVRKKKNKKSDTIITNQMQQLSNAIR